MKKNKKKAIDEELEMLKNMVEEDEMEAIAAIEDTINQSGYDAAYEQMVKLTMWGNTKYCYLLTLLALKGYGTGIQDITAAHYFSNLGAIGGDARCMYLLSRIYEQIMFSLDDLYQASLDMELENIQAHWFLKAQILNSDDRIWREINHVLQKIWRH